MWVRRLTGPRVACWGILSSKRSSKPERVGVIAAKHTVRGNTPAVCFEWNRGAAEE